MEFLVVFRDCRCLNKAFLLLFSLGAFSHLNSCSLTQADWDDLDYGATPKGSRKMLVNMDDTESLGRVNEMYEDDDENQHFDDLIFALKTGGQFEPTRDDEKEPEMDIDMRRISIADTHL